MDEYKENVVEENAAEPLAEKTEQNFSATNTPPLPKEEEKPISFWAFLGMIVLFAIPVLGWIAALIFIFAGKNKTIKNFAGAKLAYITVHAIASFLLFSVLITSMFGMILPIVNTALGTEFETLSEFVTLAADLVGGNYSRIVSGYIPALTKLLGEEYKPFLIELACGKYESLLHQLKNEQYALVLSDLEDGKYPDLVKLLDQKSYDYIKSELEKETKGIDSRLFESIDELLP